MKSRRTAILALTALATSGCGVGVHFADFRHTITPEDTRVTGSVSEVQVSSDSGHVTITAGGAGVTIHRVVHYQSGTPHPGQQLSNGTLTFSKGCSRCSIDYDLTVPASVHVRAGSDSGRVDVSGVASADARSDSGSVTVRHVKGDVSAHTDSGQVTVEDVGGSFDAGTDSGMIQASALRSAGVRASSDSGGVHLDFATAPSSVRATNDSGSLNITVPGGPYDIDAATDSGHKDITGVVSDPLAPARLYLRTDSGGLTVLPAR
ncbi:MAG: hypothetical protein JWR24_700 [Actinoallomurus sp.]|nr:hypothetical protein [Actinoallomurus sp.]